MASMITSSHQSNYASQEGFSSAANGTCGLYPYVFENNYSAWDMFSVGFLVGFSAGALEGFWHGFCRDLSDEENIAEEKPPVRTIPAKKTFQERLDALKLAASALEKLEKKCCPECREDFNEKNDFVPNHFVSGLIETEVAKLEAECRKEMKEEK